MSLEVIRELKKNVLKTSSTRTQEEKDWARANDKKTHVGLRDLSRKKYNRECADCTAKCPGWAALPHGVHICIHCAQIHRRIGRHISQVKAINTGTYLWHRDEVECLKKMGNKRAKKLYLGGAIEEPEKPKRDAAVAVHERYIRDKYEHLKWADRRFRLKKSDCKGLEVDEKSREDNNDVETETRKFVVMTSSKKKTKRTKNKKSSRSKTESRKSAKEHLRNKEHEDDLSLIDWSSEISPTPDSIETKRDSTPGTTFRDESDGSAAIPNIMSLYESGRTETGPFLPSTTGGSSSTGGAPSGMDFFAQYGL